MEATHYLQAAAARVAAAEPLALREARAAFYDASKVASITQAPSDYRERERCKQAYDLEKARHEASRPYRVRGMAEFITPAA